MRSGARRDEALKAQHAAGGEDRQHLQPARKQREQCLDARAAEPAEPQRREQHDHAGPVGDQSGDRTEDRDADQVDDEL